MHKLHLRLLNTFETNIGPATFWLHGNRSNQGLQLDYLATTPEIRAHLFQPVHHNLEGDHLPLAATMHLQGNIRKTYVKSMLGWTPNSTLEYNEHLLAQL